MEDGGATRYPVQDYDYEVDQTAEHSSAPADTVAEIHSLPMEAIRTYDYLPEAHQEALVRANSAIEYIAEDDPQVRIQHEGEPVTGECGVYFLGISPEEEKGREITHLGFEVYEEMLSGKIESAHAVLPGVLTYDIEVTNGISENKSACEQVAIKGYSKREFADRLERVNKEIDISKQMIANGELGFSPVAAVIAPAYFNKDGNGNSIFLLTRLEDEIFTLDNASWHRGPAEESNAALLDKSVSALARFNKTIGKHGDSKLKNIAQSTDGRVSMIDFETSEQFSPEQLADGLTAADVAESDLSMFLKSLKDTGFFRGLNSYESSTAVMNLLETYVSHWSEEPEDLQEAVLNGAIKASEMLEPTS